MKTKNKPAMKIISSYGCKKKDIPSSARYVLYVNGNPEYYISRYEGMLCTRPIENPPTSLYYMTEFRRLIDLMLDIAQEEECKNSGGIPRYRDIFPGKMIDLDTQNRYKSDIK